MILESVEFWKTFGMVSTPLLGIVGGIVIILRSREKNNLDILQEKHQSFVNEKYIEVEKIAESNINKVKEMIQKHDGEMKLIKQDISHMIKDNTSEMQSFFEVAQSNVNKVNINFMESINQFDDKMSKMLISLNSMHEKINEMEVAKTAKKDFVKQLYQLLNGALDFIPEELREFTSLKGTKFIEYVMDIRSLDFSDPDINIDMIFKKGEYVSEEVKREGYELLGMPFVDLYYDIHRIKLEAFLKKVAVIIKEQNNDKKFRFQIACLEFMNTFLQLMNKCYLSNKNLIVHCKDKK